MIETEKQVLNYFIYHITLMGTLKEFNSRLTDDYTNKRKSLTQLTSNTNAMELCHVGRTVPVVYF